MSENRTEVGDGVVGLEILGRDSKELLQGIQNLRHLGVEEFVVPLPKIVVVGQYMLKLQQLEACLTASRRSKHREKLSH